MWTTVMYGNWLIDSISMVERAPLPSFQVVTVSILGHEHWLFVAQCISTLSFVLLLFLLSSFYTLHLRAFFCCMGLYHIGRRRLLHLWGFY